MRVRLRFIVAAGFLAGAACGGSSAEWAGKWKQPVAIGIASYVECTLGGSGTTVTGSGTQHREGGADLGFTVSGTTTAGVTFAYDGGTTEAFTFAQPDPDHISLTNPQRTVNLVRQ